MFKKLAGYSFLTVVSFCFFTLFFHTIVNAQSGTLIVAQQVISPTVDPSPTIFFVPPPHTYTPAPQQLTQAPSPTDQPIAQKKTESQTVNTPQVTPTPTIFVVTPTNPPPFFGQPTPTSLPTQAPVLAPAELEALFTKYSEQYGINKDQLKKIAKCESNFHTTSNNSGLYLGMYQFAAQTWASVREAMGLDTNTELRTNAEESIKTAAYMLSKGRQAAWPNCH